MNTNADRYHTLSIAIHWLMLMAFIATYASIELRVLFEKGTPTRETFKNIHFMIGLVVFFLVWVRIALRIRFAPPPISPEPSQLLNLGARLGHLALYVLMIGMPMVGWIILSASGKPIPFFGMELPALVAENKALAKQLKEIHETIGIAGYALIGIHASAALFHHYFLRDNTLRRMLLTRT
jgi:cytochrome b561